MSWYLVGPGGVRASLPAWTATVLGRGPLLLLTDVRSSRCEAQAKVTGAGLQVLVVRLAMRELRVGVSFLIVTLG